MLAYLKTTSPGVELFYRLDNAVNAKANIIINHGFAEHLGRYDHVAQQLVEAGYNVLRYDLRGHGQTKGLKGHIESYEDFIDDADAMVKLMALNNPGLPNFMLGHSMGGLVTTLYGLKHPEKLAGQIISGAANGKIPDAKSLKAKGLSAIVKLTPKLQVKNPVNDDICSVEKVVEDYLKDPLVLKSATVNFYHEFLNKATDQLLENVDAYSLPILILHGEKDKVVPAEISQTLYERIQSMDKELHIYPELYHEIFNEEINDEIIHYVINWLDLRIKALI